jgi:anti-sigma regulatory factor (Ser/Thr protein kinase)
MNRLIKEGIIVATGNTRARHYKFKLLVDEYIHTERTGFWNEDNIWREQVRPLMKGVKQNIIDIYQYAVTEMVNNVLDHSVSPDIDVHYEQTYKYIRIDITDHGVGIFKKIQTDFHLEDARTALLELSKGKLTSDKKRHAGEGIYFTSRMFDEFSILSGHLCYVRKRGDDNEWLIEALDRKNDSKGTFISMIISTDAKWSKADVFERYQGDDIYFRKTHIPVSLGRYPGEQLVSRSQAKRILARANVFSEVFLDFRGVGEIGQPFADEIFRVYKNEHPEIEILAFNTNQAIDKMIKYVTASADPSGFSSDAGPS